MAMGVAKVTTRTENNYTGIAKPKTDKDGNSFLVACEYENVGMYSPCVKLEDGKMIAIGLGGFHKETAFSESGGGKAYPVVIESFETS